MDRPNMADPNKKERDLLSEIYDLYLCGEEGRHLLELFFLKKKGQTTRGR